MSGSKHWTEFTFIDLFAGIGGNRLALERAGGECLLASEPNESARQVYFMNFGETPVEDIEKINESDIPGHDVLSASLPSTAFSLMSASSRRGGFERSLFQKITQILEAKRPRAFLLQCSLSLTKSRAIHDIKETLKTELGYDIHEQAIDASCAVPQSHKRLYITGFREKTPFQFPTFEGAPKLRDILETSVDPKYTLPDQRWAQVRERIRSHETQQTRPATQRFEVADLNDVLHRPFNNRTVREVFIPQDGGRNSRRLTPRECARLMGFPDSFKLPASDSQAYALLSHSPVVPVVEKIANTIREHLFEEAGIEELGKRPEEQDMPWRAFQDRVASWLRRVYGYDVETPSMVSGGATLRPYDVDVRAWKRAGLVRGRVDVWVECKKLRISVRRSHVAHLIQKAREVKDGGNWSPNILMLAAEGGFDSDAVRLADKYRVYLVNAGPKGYQFTGKMSKDDFNKYNFSEF